MHCNRAIGVVLIGWLLIAPPLKTPAFQVDTQAPLGEWKLMGKYDTADKCKARQAKVAAAAPRFKLPDSAQQSAVRLRMTKYQCVTDDDPRLKPK